MWNGTAETLKQKPANRNTSPKIEPDAARVRRLGDAGEAHRAGEAVDQRGAVEQHAGGQRAEDEIFEAGLRRAHGIAVDRRDHVERQAHQFEAEIERDQIGRRDQHQHAGGRQQDQDRIFELLLLLAREIVERHQDRDGRAGQREQLEEARERIDDEAAAEGRELAAPAARPRSRRPQPAAAIASQLTATAVRSPRNAPSIRSAMAPSASTISGSAGSRAGSATRSFIGIHRSDSNAVSSRCRAHACSCRAAAPPMRPTGRAPASERRRTGSSARRAARA